MRNKWLAGACFFLSGLTPTFAEQVTFEIQATVYDIYDPGNVLQGAINLGNNVSGSYTFDTNVQDFDSSPEFGHFDQTLGSGSGFDININQENVRSDRNNPGFMYEIHIENYLSDFYHVASWGNTPLQNGALVNDIIIDLYDGNGNALDTSDLSTTAPDVNAFMYRDMIIAGSNSSNTQYYHVMAKVDLIKMATPDDSDPNIAVFNLKASVRDVWDPAGALNNTVRIGDALQGNYSVNLTTADSDASPEFGKYIHRPSSGEYGFNLNVGGHNMQTNTNAVEFIVELYDGAPGPDHYSILSYGPNYPLSTGASVEDIGLFIYDDSGTMLSSAQLNGAAPTLPSGGFNEVYIWGMHPNGIDSYHIVADIQSITTKTANAPSLVAISPGTGVFDRSQQFDMGIIFQANLPWMMDMSVSINGMDETPSLFSCRPGMPNPQNRQTFVCPGYSSLPMLRNGANTLDFRFILEDGSVLQESVEWEILGF